MARTPRIPGWMPRSQAGARSANSIAPDAFGRNASIPGRSRRRFATTDDRKRRFGDLRTRPPFPSIFASGDPIVPSDSSATLPVENNTLPGLSHSYGWYSIAKKAHVGWTLMKNRIAITQNDLVSHVQPETLVWWHRAGFRRYCRWKSNSRGGRRQIEIELRADPANEHGEPALGGDALAVDVTGLQRHHFGDARNPAHAQRRLGRRRRIERSPRDQRRVFRRL
jgi:hypothetical protein